ncbi:type I restriction enzyme endonuclease domain-containing protein [Bacillota bacterium Lsc_1132]
MYFIIIQAADIVRMMVQLNKEIEEEAKQRDDLGLSDEEIEFFKVIISLELDVFDNQFIADLIHKTVKEVKNSSQLI